MVFLVVFLIKRETLRAPAATVEVVGVIWCRSALMFSVSDTVRNSLRGAANAAVTDSVSATCLPRAVVTDITPLTERVSATLRP